MRLLRFRRGIEARRDVIGVEPEVGGRCFAERIGKRRRLTFERGDRVARVRLREARGIELRAGIEQRDELVEPRPRDDDRRGRRQQQLREHRTQRGVGVVLRLCKHGGSVEQ